MLSLRVVFSSMSLTHLSRSEGKAWVFSGKFSVFLEASKYLQSTEWTRADGGTLWETAT